MDYLQIQPPIRSLPPFIIFKKTQLRQASLNEIVRALDDMLPEYTHTGIAAEVKLTTEDLTIMADVALMRKALMNLVQNAMDAMPHGGKFSLKTDRVSFNNGSPLENNGHSFGPCGLISLADTGIGMEENLKEKIFEPFFTTKEGDNKGLGLPIASHIIKEHGGIMNVKSTIGQGTVVDVYLPLMWSQIMSAVPIPLLEKFN
jgi:two-component system, cell cycle sensor histidine kinase and response regulator CckA